MYEYVWNSDNEILNALRVNKTFRKLFYLFVISICQQKCQRIEKKFWVDDFWEKLCYNNLVRLEEEHKQSCQTAVKLKCQDIKETFSVRKWQWPWKLSYNLKLSAVVPQNSSTLTLIHMYIIPYIILQIHRDILTWKKICNK